MSKRKSYFIRSEGPDQSAVKKALEWAVAQPGDQIYVAALGYGNLKRPSVIAEVLGEKSVSAMIEGKLIINGKSVSLVTKRKKIYYGNNRSLVAFFPNPSFLDELDSIPDISAMLVVPLIFEEIEPWIKTWNALELGAKEPSTVTPLLRSRVVEEALKTLTALVNVSTGISHPDDKATAIEVLTILRDANEPFTPQEVKSWLTAKGGWMATEAEEVAELATKILERKRLQKGRQKLRPNILEIWQKSAESSKTDSQAS